MSYINRVQSYVDQHAIPQDIQGNYDLIFTHFPNGNIQYVAVHQECSMAYVIASASLEKRVEVVLMGISAEVESRVFDCLNHLYLLGLEFSPANIARFISAKLTECQ